MRLSATFTVEGSEPTTVVARPGDIMAWEMGNKKRITDGMGYADLMSIIHSAAKREGLTDRPFTDWASSLTDFEPDAEGGKPDPTQTDQSTD